MTYGTLTCCQAVESVTCALADEMSVLPLYSCSLILKMAPAVSERTHADAVYVPAVVAVTQFGESCSVAKLLAEVPVFVSFADQLPVWPPETRASVMFEPEPEVFHPERSVSKP